MNLRRHKSAFVKSRLFRIFEKSCIWKSFFKYTFQCRLNKCSPVPDLQIMTIIREQRLLMFRKGRSRALSWRIWQNSRPNLVSLFKWTPSIWGKLLTALSQSLFYSSGFLIITLQCSSNICIWTVSKPLWTIILYTVYYWNKYPCIWERFFLLLKLLFWPQNKKSFPIKKRL